MKAMIYSDEASEDDDYDLPRDGTGKKGTARKKSKRERQAQRRLSKL